MSQGPLRCRPRAPRLGARDAAMCCLPQAHVQHASARRKGRAALSRPRGAPGTDPGVAGSQRRDSGAAARLCFIEHGGRVVGRHEQLVADVGRYLRRQHAALSLPAHATGNLPIEPHCDSAVEASLFGPPQKAGPALKIYIYISMPNSAHNQGRSLAVAWQASESGGRAPRSPGARRAASCARRSSSTPRRRRRRRGPRARRLAPGTTPELADACAGAVGCHECAL